MRKVLFVISVILFILFLRLAIKGVGNVNLPLLSDIEKSVEDGENKPFTMLNSKIIEPRAHICFQGTTLNGTLSDVVYKLENSGFKLIQERLNTASLKGRMMGYEQTDIYVESCPVCLEVYRVTAYPPVAAHWKDLYREYRRIKDILTERHGNPIHTTERFMHPVSLEDEMQCEYALKNGECEYKSIYRVAGGRIELSIQSLKEHKSQFVLSIRYIDDENYEDRGYCTRQHH